ncbi:DUF305 domain-containing protein [Microbacterium trichothecenolyticum]|uniref:DUF305 domain-containing protein n=1 Tax=Microbacterium trichothecenolyticum TaxID=69370 RepID=UPI0035BE7242
MRRRVVLVVALTLALLTAAAGVWLAIAATAGNTDAAPAGSASPSASSSTPVTADDYCYVEAMIYYRVEEQELAEALLRKQGLDAAANGFATGIAARNADELEDLRAWYLSWADARPAEPPTEGPCGGHGSDHAQMPGMPSWSALQGYVDAEHPDAERRFGEILQAQNAGMIALVTLILEGDPHPAVAESAEEALQQAEADQETLQGILDALP